MTIDTTSSSPKAATTTTTEGPSGGRIKEAAGVYAKNTLFLRGFPSETSNKDLETFFGEFGPLRSAFVVVKKDKDEGGKGTGRGIGFVHYAMTEDAQSALDAINNGSLFSGKKIFAEFAVRKHAAQDVPERKRVKKELKEPVAAPETKKPKASTESTPAQSKIVILDLCNIEGGKVIKFDKKQLYKKVKKLGSVAELVYPFEDSKHRAKVVFASMAEAVNAQTKLHEHIFKGHRLSATFKVEIPMKAHRLIVRNVPFKLTLEKLKQAFSAFGNVVEASLPKKANGLSCGFGFVQMETREQAELAMAQINGKELEGRLVAVDWALKKDLYQKLTTVEGSSPKGVETEGRENSVADEGSETDEFSSSEE